MGSVLCPTKIDTRDLFETMMLGRDQVKQKGSLRAGKPWMTLDRMAGCSAGGDFESLALGRHRRRKVYVVNVMNLYLCFSLIRYLWPVPGK